MQQIYIKNIIRLKYTKLNFKYVKNMMKALFAQDIPAVLEMLKTGSERANVVAEATMKDVRYAMGIDYFG